MGTLSESEADSAYVLYRPPAGLHTGPRDHRKHFQSAEKRIVKRVVELPSDDEKDEEDDGSAASAIAAARKRSQG